MKKYFIVVAIVIAILATVGHSVCNYGRNLLNIATEQMQVTKPAPSLTQEYHGGLIHYVK